MRRQEIQLLAQARQGDIAARIEVGRRYLSGLDGLPRHVPTGLEYLAHPSVTATREATTVVVSALELQELIDLGQEDRLRAAADAGVGAAQVKMGAWLVATAPDPILGKRYLEGALASGRMEAESALAALRLGTPDTRQRVLRVLNSARALDGKAVSTLALRRALHNGDISLVNDCLRCLLSFASSGDPEVPALVVQALSMAERGNAQSIELEAGLIEQCLEVQANRNDMEAAVILGRALCGIQGDGLPPASLVSGQNMRKGAALLLRAADSGYDKAWSLLYRVHANPHASVANPLMARFFLEKAAARGDIVAQRKLGAVLLKAALRIEESERGIHWLYEASRNGDAFATELLKLLVLEVKGDEDEAAASIRTAQREFPWLAWRLRISRDYGLTKLEALSFDPGLGLRSWGLVVSRNPFVSQVRLSAPRAIPAVTPTALQNLQRAAVFFDQGRREGGAVEGDLRARSIRQRRLFQRHELVESMFFADANSATLESLRQGPKWAFRARKPLRAALSM